MSQECLQAAPGRVGKWNLTLPTGAGKTLSSLRFALEHARRHHLSRIIYIIPYTSILDQTANAIRKVLGDEYKDCILEHHSNLVKETLNKEGELEPWSPERKTWYMEATQTWNVPIVLATSVQYLNALYASGKQHVRRMHSLANAVVIFDEVQAIPPTSLRLLNIRWIFFPASATAAPSAVRLRLRKLPRKTERMLISSKYLLFRTAKLTSINLANSVNARLSVNGNPPITGL